ncbi:MAG: hypothetical protein AAF982_11480, partial [Pseudomonadota bacterium]
PRITVLDCFAGRNARDVRRDILIFAAEGHIVTSLVLPSVVSGFLSRSGVARPVRFILRRHGPHDPCVCARPWTGGDRGAHRKSFQTAIEEEPFFIAWRPGSFGDVALAQADDIPIAENTRVRDLMRVTLNIRARGYD